ncbi:MAG TPA: hypothetical protein VL171_08870 [Verrucomicrobiae bacterium]|nr:hypothetical protein [Verrucomicrobiae bacterium]
MKITRRVILISTVVLDLVAAPVSHAQYTDDFQTNIISGVTSNWVGTYKVGDANSADVLLIQSNGVLTDDGGYLGNLFFSSNNFALVTDSGSIWSNSFFYVGYLGMGNSLVVSNGGHVISAGIGYVGAGSTPRTTSNSVVVTGSGSVWSNADTLTVGSYVAGNQVIVKDGGLLNDNNGYVGLAAYTASNNSVLVTDAATWTNRGDLYLGDQGVGCSLVISNGGKTFCGNGYVGYTSSGSNNSVTVTGTGSLWTNSYDLYVGRDGQHNSLFIGSSGTVYSAVGHIGYNSTAASNSVSVSGTGSVWSAAEEICVGQNGSHNNLTVSDHGQVTPRGDGRFFVGGDTSQNANASRNRVLVTGGAVFINTFLNASAPVYIGYSGAGNSLVISNGGKMISGYGYVGEWYTSSNNSVLVADSGSVWSNHNDLYVGEFGSSNTLLIADGGLVNDVNGFVGYSSSSNNVVVVTGSGSVWSNRGTLYLNYPRNNSLVISNGGHVVSSGSYFSKSRVLVAGTGSVWSNGDYHSNFSSTLVISNAGQVINGDAYAGYGGNDDSLRVADGGIWQNGALYVGYQGANNSLIVSGGSVLATSLVIGVSAPACDNLLQLDAGSVTVTNATHDAVFEVQNGQLILNGGTLQVDQFVMTNACAQFIRTGGTLIYETAVLDPNRDDDGDGLPNGWEQQYGLDPLDPNGMNGANGDPDGDGQSNLAEYQAGTDPTNNASAFRILEVAPTDDDMLVTWDAVGGKWYVVQTATNLDLGLSNSFYDLDPVIIAPGTDEYPLSVIHLGAATNAPVRFYRIRLVP